MRAHIRNNTSGAWLYWIIYGLAWVLAHLVSRYSVTGREHVPETGPLLIVANHLSWYDPVMLGLALRRRIWFFTKKEMFSWPVVGWMCRVTGQIPVHRGEGDRAALEKALAYLQEGKMLVMFPEGTVERQEQMIPAHTGAAMLALHSGATILPVAHLGSRRVLRRGKGWFPWVRVYIGKPYVPELPTGVSRKMRLQEITQDVMERIAEMLPVENRGVYADRYLHAQIDMENRGI